VLIAVGAYLAAAIAFQIVVVGAVAGARITGNDPRPSGSPVANLRVVDDTVIAGAQPDEDGYRALARMGVSTVVDLRTGAPDDPREDDPAFLRRIGIEHVRLPVPDGHVPRQAILNRFRALVARSDGRVFVHCGGGVGRSSALEVAYGASSGNGRAFWDVVAVGPMTLEQLWLAARSTSADPLPSNVIVRRLSEFVDAPRRGWSRLRAAL